LSLLRRWLAIGVSVLFVVSGLMFQNTKVTYAAGHKQHFTVIVQRLPDTVEVDLVNKTLPPLPNAKVQVSELGITKVAGADGSVTFDLKPGVYTFNVSHASAPFTTSVKKVIDSDMDTMLIHYNRQQDATLDYSVRPDHNKTAQHALSSSSVTPYAISIDPHVPSTVTVWSPANNKAYVYSFQDYVKKVLAAEVALGTYKTYLTDAQELTMYTAHSIVSRTYATYHLWYSGCSQNASYKLDDTTWCQVVDHTFLTTSTNNINSAVDQTNHRLAIHVTDLQNGLFEYIDATFFASDNGTTQSSQAVWGSAHSYLVAVTDQYDEDVSNWICTNKPGIGYCPSPRVGGYAGHGVGFSQDGNAGYAKNGLGSSWIISHFYTGTSLYTASESTGP
jgi:peptidoglycan hydrolase-like amidase